MTLAVRTGRFVAGGAAIAVAGLVVKDAWVCDDAYITFRHVDHLWLGHGLEWNVGERVQGSTHPLWLMLLAALHPLTGQPFWSALALGLLCSAALIWLFSARAVPDPWAAFAGLGALGASKAFIDFSTSGLENALTHLLLVGVSAAAGRQKDRTVGILAGLLLLNRLDTVLLIAPLLVWRMLATRGRAGIALLPSAVIPGIWILFSLIYFGEPLPNTALAKLAQQIPAADRMAQGVAYLANSWSWDPATLGVLGLGALAGLLASRRDPLALALAAGGLLGIGYCVRIGGDFMSGRFLAAPLLCGALGLGRALCTAPARPVLATLIVMGTVGLSATTDRSPLRTGLAFSDVSWDETGIADERGFYFQAQGLWPMLQQGRAPEAPGRPETHDHGDTVLVDRTVGINGYTAGPHVHLIDRYALTDPLLARLPVRFAPGWRPGHWDRPIPPGYRATLRSGRLQFTDPDIQACFQRVRRVHAGPLFTIERARAMWVLNTRGCDDLWRGRWMHPQTTEWQVD